MGFFSSIGNAFKSGFNTVKNTVSSVVSPVVNKVIKPAYEKAIKPVAERGIKFVDHAINRVERVADASTQGLEGISGLLNSQPFMYVALGVGGLVAYNVLSK